MQNEEGGRRRLQGYGNELEFSDSGAQFGSGDFRPWCSGAHLPHEAGSF